MMSTKGATDEEILKHVRYLERQENEYHSSGGCVLDTRRARALREHIMRSLFKLHKAKALMVSTGIFILKEDDE